MKHLSYYLLLLLVHCSLLAEEAGPIMLYTEHFPPYNFEDEGTLKGINFELVELMCKRAKLDCQFTLLSWNRAYQAAKNNQNSGVFSTSRNAQRELKFLWVGPLVSSTANFYRLKSRSDISIVNETDLLKYTVAAAHNDVYEDVLLDLGFEQNKNLLDVSGADNGTKLFLAGKLDLMIASPNTLVHKVGSKIDLIEPVFSLDTAKLEGNHIAFNLDTSPIIIKKLNDALIELYQKDIQQQLIEKYAL